METENMSIIRHVCSQTNSANPEEVPCTILLENTKSFPIFTANYLV